MTLLWFCHTKFVSCSKPKTKKKHKIVKKKSIRVNTKRLKSSLSQTHQMPYKEIDYSGAKKSLSNSDGSPLVVSTPNGNVMLEIQGELILPSAKPQGLTPEEESKYVAIDGVNHAVKIGRLELNGNKATLFIGTSQRLLGDVKKLNPPIGVLRLPNDAEDDAKIKMVDIIKHKIIFTGRPLPIM